MFLIPFRSLEGWFCPHGRIEFTGIPEVNHMPWTLPGSHSDSKAPLHRVITLELSVHPGPANTGIRT